MDTKYFKDTYSIYHKVTYRGKTKINKIENCHISLVDVDHEIAVLELPNSEDVPIEHLPNSVVFAKFMPKNKYIPIYVDSDEHGTEVINEISKVIHNNKSSFTYTKFGECLGEPFIYELGIYKDKSDEYMKRYFYSITRTVEVLGYTKTLLYPSYEVHSSNILQNSYSYIELPDELGLGIKDFPHFQRVLSLYPNCLNIPVLGDYIQVLQLNDELNEFLNQTAITSFHKSYFTNHDGMVIKFTLELKRKVN